MMIRQIKSDAEHAAALAEIGRRWNAEPGTPEHNELEMLGDAGRFIVEDRDELGPDALALGFRIGDPGKLTQEALAGIDSHNVEAEFVAQILLHTDEFVLPQDPIVDEDAGKLAADGFVQQRRRHAGIHPAAQAQDYFFVADLGADFRHGTSFARRWSTEISTGSVDELHGPVSGSEAADV